MATASTNEPSVTWTQWVLAAASLVVAGVQYLKSGWAEPSTSVWILAGLGIVLSGFAAVDLLRQRAFGKLLVCAGVFYYFWLEAAASASEDPAFSVSPRLGLGKQFSPTVVSTSLFLVAIFQFSLLAGYAFRSNVGERLILSREDRRGSISRVSRVILALLAYATLLISTGFSVSATRNIMFAGRGGDTQGAEAVQDPGLLHFLSYFGMFGSAWYLIAALDRSAPSRVLAVSTGILAALPMLSTGARHLMLYVVVPPAVFWLKTRVKTVRTGHIVAVLLGGISILLFAQLQLALRMSGWSGIADLTLSQLLEGKATGQFDAVCYSVTLVPSTHDYFHEPATPFFIIHWIPRVIWPTKPTMAAWAFFNDAYTMGDRGFNVTPSVVGQFYMNWGVIGVPMIGVWLGFLARWLDAAVLRLDADRQRGPLVVLGMLYAFVISSFRYYHPLYFAYVVFGLIAMYALTRSKGRPVINPEDYQLGAVSESLRAPPPEKRVTA